MFHLFAGSEGRPCAECGRMGQDFMHLTNAGLVCDALDGPCACGAWHKDGEQLDKLKDRSKQLMDWTERIADPEHEPTKRDMAIFKWVEGEPWVDPDWERTAVGC